MPKSIDTVTTEEFAALRQRANANLPEALALSIADAGKNEVPFYDNQNKNISYLIRQSGSDKRVMLINNNYRFIQLAEKGLLNPYASSLDGLFTKHSGLASQIGNNQMQPDATTNIFSNVFNKIIDMMSLPGEYLNEVTRVIMPSLSQSADAAVSDSVAP